MGVNFRNFLFFFPIKYFISNIIAKGTVWVPMHGASKEPFNIFNKTGNIYSRDVAQVNYLN
jgi:hypothetical protein